MGSDALRWHLVASPLMKGGDLRIDREGKAIAEAVRFAIHPIWNAYAFFCLYANTDGVRAEFRTDAPGLLDRYILAKTRELVEGVQAELDAYELAAACGRVAGFIEALNNWYIRRSRARFWSADTGAEDKRDAYDTLYAVLVTTCRVLSPLLPMVTEEIYRGLTEETSVHLSDWPDAAAFPADPELVAGMDRARDVCSAALALRAAVNARVRQPLAELVVAGPASETLRPYADLVADEVNVKRVRFTEEIDAYATPRLQVNARAVGPRLGGRTKEVIAASKRGEWERTGDGVAVAGEALAPGEYELQLQPNEGVTCEPLPGRDGIVALELELTDELVSEGRARDVVRAVQQARKEAGLHVSDRIRLALALPDDWRESVEQFRDYVSEQTLATELALDGEHPAELSQHSATLGGEDVRIALARTDP